ncbi:MAG: arsenite methyltransferase [Candidatus Glassbacteria bacterium]|nr:arsenite methyltransferase [Candidatus Glassbacteria bacterium]
MSEKRIKRAVREGYGKIARGEVSSCCGPGVSPCCGGGQAYQIAEKIGYSKQEVASAPEGANLGLGCGNPLALAELRPGETVLDLGSGAGFDCFLASARVGESGQVIGVDMTPEMIEKARANAGRGGFRNVEFRLGEIDSLPVEDSSIDVVISNCVINLVPDKRRAFAEAYRVLKPGGRFMISDMVSTVSIPDFIRRSVEAWVGCLGARRDEYLEDLRSAGFAEVEVVEETPLPWEVMAPTAEAIIREQGVTPGQLEKFAGSVRSIKVRGVKG